MVDQMRVELALLRELEAWARECGLRHLHGGKLKQLLAEPDELRNKP